MGLRRILSSGIVAAAVAFQVLAAAGPLHAQQEPVSSLDQAATWGMLLKEAEKYVQGSVHTPERSAGFRDLLGVVRDEALALKTEVEPDLKSAQNLLDAMGPPPGDGEPPEPDDVAANRHKYGEEVAALRARLAQADLTLARIVELEAAISTRVRERLLERILKPVPVPLSPDVVATAVADFFKTLEIFLRSPLDWYQSLSKRNLEKMVVWRFVFVIILAVFTGWGVRRLLLRHLGRDPRIDAPTYARRFVATIAEGVARGIVPALIVAAFVFWIAQPGALITGLFLDVSISLLKALFVFILATAFARAVLAPNLPAWRLIELPSDSARIINRRLVFLAAVFAVDLFLEQTFEGMMVSAELQSVYRFAVTTLEAFAILALTQARLWQGEKADIEDAGLAEEKAEAEAKRRGIWTLLRHGAAALSVIAVLALLVGYGGIGRFVVRGMLGSGVVIGLLILVRGLLRELAGVLTGSQVARRRLGIGAGTLRSAKFWIRAALDPALFVAGVFLIAPVWGVPQDDLVRWTLAVLKGFTIGNVTISPADIALALVTFIAAMAVTRFIQQTLLERVLPETKMDIGVQHSLSSGVGYVGVIIAFALAIAVIGVDLTNIALIAGALSVGIGFGLQNIVNNFVSGLILLIERPIKVGDWVIIGDKEGFVKRVNFRATELETRQRASVLIPNAEILSTPLTNWTLKDRFGRIDIPVGVAYGSDTAKVRDILLACARDHPNVSSYPEINVLFRDFGSSSLDFELRCFTPNVIERPFVASDIRFEIDRRFREEGVEIPFPQRVVHFPDDAKAAKTKRRPKPPAEDKE